MIPPSAETKNRTKEAAFCSPFPPGTVQIFVFGLLLPALGLTVYSGQIWVPLEAQATATNLTKFKHC